jgi:acetyltransferase
MESIGDARAFLSAAREVALNKPIIVIKPGRTAAAAKAAASHTGSLTGSDEVLEAAFRRSGVLRVNNIADLFYMAEVLAKQPSPKGPRLTIVTNAGGPGVLATDALIMGGGELAELSPGTDGGLQRRSAPHLEPQQSGRYHRRRQPGALRQGAGDRRQRSQQRRHAGDPDAAGHDRSHADRRAAEAAAKQEGKPVLASWMGGVDVAAGERF